MKFPAGVFQNEKRKKISHNFPVVLIKRSGISRREIFFPGTTPRITAMFHFPTLLFSNASVDLYYPPFDLYTRSRRNLLEVRFVTNFITLMMLLF